MSHPLLPAEDPAAPADIRPTPTADLSYAGITRVAGWLRLVCLVGAIVAATPGLGLLRDGVAALLGKDTLYMGALLDLPGVVRVATALAGLATAIACVRGSLGRSTRTDLAAAGFVVLAALATAEAIVEISRWVDGFGPAYAVGFFGLAWVQTMAVYILLLGLLLTPLRRRLGLSPNGARLAYAASGRSRGVLASSAGAPTSRPAVRRTS